MTAGITQDKLTVAVTGASGFIATRLIETLCAEPSVDRILGFDVRAPSIIHDKFLFDHMDVRNPEIGGRLNGVDVLVHLAFVMDPIKDETLMRDINVNGSQNVFRCAGTAGVQKVVYTSSGVAYGAHPDNDVPLTEDSPLRANLDLSYAAHKLEVEYVVREFREEYPSATMTVLRPCIVLGPHVDSAWSHLMEMPVLIGVRDHNTPFQFVHEDDVTAALVFAIQNDIDGAFNLAPSDRLTADEIARLLGRRMVQLPEPAVFSLSERLWKAGLAEAPAGMIHYVMHSWVMAPDKLAGAGFTPQRSTLEALESVVDGARSHVRLGRVRVRRADLVRGAAGAAAMGTAVALLARRRR
jgi:UDP-glucose 4-epimerase